MEVRNSAKLAHRAHGVPVVYGVAFERTAPKILLLISALGDVGAAGGQWMPVIPIGRVYCLSGLAGLAVGYLAG